jgi:hypothetical protein
VAERSEAGWGFRGLRTKSVHYDPPPGPPLALLAQASLRSLRKLACVRPPSHPNSGLPELGTLGRPKSDISDLGWGRMNRELLLRLQNYFFAFNGSLTAGKVSN